MVINRTITVTQAKPKTTISPVAWIVRLDSQEFTHGNDYALEFETIEEAAQFALELKSEHGPEASIDILGLDEFGLFLPRAEKKSSYSSTNWMDWVEEFDLIEPIAKTYTEKILQQIEQALFIDANALEKSELILALYAKILLPTQLKNLQNLDPAFLVSRLKNNLPARNIEYAEMIAIFRKWKRSRHLE